MLAPSVLEAMPALSDAYPATAFFDFLLLQYAENDFGLVHANGDLENLIYEVVPSP